MARIFDNIDQKLGPHLELTFPGHDRMDAAVGYFNLRGWSIFAPHVERRAAVENSPLPVVRVLVGMVAGTEQQQALEELQRQLEHSGLSDEPTIDHALARERTTALIRHLREQLMRGIPTPRDRATLRTLRDQISRGLVELRVYTRRPLHGKTYIFHRDDPNHPRLAFVGSSNLTAAGLLSNYELNVDVTDYDGAEALASWFNDRWDDRFSYNITSELLEVLDDSWAGQPRRPYDVYLKLCYELSRDVRDGLAEYSLVGAIQDQLLDYQRDAVKTLARRIMARGGTMLGDVVGLGKTLTAVAVALLLLDEHRYSTLVVCPKNLVKMWEDHLAAYQVPGKVVPYSTVARDLPTLRRYHFVIVDESHTMRNEDRQDYQALHEYISTNDCKVLLLTATPYNIAFTDVAAQIALWIRPDDDLGLQPTVALRNDPQLARRLDGRTSTLAAFRKSEEAEDWQRLMSEHLVRRTRSFIKKRASDSGQVDERGVYLTFADGRRFYFPSRRAVPLQHSFGPADPANLMASDGTLGLSRHECG
ncbi:MAG: phospholipase D-like domain-containing protein [Candidatus Nanopelagicales bacterium]|nr:phospholipase D-like domain-containing protein [Candidatus Nanopelagicales bacterium]